MTRGEINLPNYNTRGKVILDFIQMKFKATFFFLLTFNIHANIIIVEKYEAIASMVLP